MTTAFTSQLADDLSAFLKFKRDLGYRYERVPSVLRSLDRFIAADARSTHTRRFDQTLLAWLTARTDTRKPISILYDISVARELCSYLRRQHPRRAIREPLWPRLPTSSTFVPTILSTAQVRKLLKHTSQLGGPRFRRDLCRTLILVLYCTGLRLGEARRLRVRDVDLETATLFVAESKGRSRWVPFHSSLARELKRYLNARRKVVDASADEPFFVTTAGRKLSSSTAEYNICSLLRKAGLKPSVGRAGPRIHDLRHTFAVHRLTRWYRDGSDVTSRLPLLSAYMGHTNMLGTETYLTATPELLVLASHRFRRRFINGEK